VTSSNEADITSLVAQIASLSSKSLSSKRRFYQTWHKQDPGLLMFINTTGCRPKVLMALFDDPATFEEDAGDEIMCCDNCIKKALDAGLLPECPIIHGIPVSLGLAFQMQKDTRISQSTVRSDSSDDEPETQSETRVKVCASRIEKVKTAVRAWRIIVSRARKVLTPGQVLSEKAIRKIGNAVKANEVTEGLIREKLEQSGMNMATPGIRNHISALVETIAQSLSESIGEQPKPREPPPASLGERPPAPPALPFFITSEQIAYDAFLQAQQDKIKEAEEKKRKLKEKKNAKRKNEEAEQTHNSRSRLFAPTSVVGDGGAVIHLVYSERLICRTLLRLQTLVGSYHQRNTF
jgi:hypothetical protein